MAFLLVFKLLRIVVVLLLLQVKVLLIRHRLQMWQVLRLHLLIRQVLNILIVHQIPSLKRNVKNVEALDAVAQQTMGQGRTIVVVPKNVTIVMGMVTITQMVIK